jgi:phage tail-like protein
MTGTVRAAVPDVYLEDPLVELLCLTMDDLLAPTISMLDCFPAYLDPTLAPDEFVPWLAQLVGAVPHAEAIGSAVASYGLRGTPEGLRRSAAAVAGVAIDAVEVIDVGGVTWSATAGSDVPPAGAAITVKISVGGRTNAAQLSADVRNAVESMVPVHCTLDVEVTPR